jgi:hypothetical protein
VINQTFIAGQADYELQGVLKIRLIDAPPQTLSGLRIGFGSLQASSTNSSPDLSIRFVDALPISDDLRYLGLHQAAYDLDTFYLFDSRGRRAAVPIDQLGDPCEIVCERDLADIPLLREAVGLRLLAKGHVMLHSGAFTTEGKTVLVTGWQKGGKTELTLAFVSGGARFVSDEWTILRGDSHELLSATGRLDIWDWQLRQLPNYWRKIRRSERVRLRLLRLYRTGYRLLRPPLLSSFGLDLLHRLSEEGGVASVGQVRAAPGRLFGRQHAGEARVDAIVLAAVAAGPSRAHPLDAGEVALRMIGSQTYERKPLHEAYAAFRYAFPTRTNLGLEGAPQRELELLRSFMRGIPAYEVLHPYPVSLRELRDLVQPLLAAARVTADHDASIPGSNSVEDS